ncbi:hypothetical protein [Actinophytocola sp.]|nr:hypothetical protein [Actinophytocola sp.]
MASVRDPRGFLAFLEGVLGSRKMFWRLMLLLALVLLGVVAVLGPALRRS